MIEERIRQVRRALRLTQAEFGEMLGVSRDVIGNIEYKRVEPKDVFLNHLCRIFGVNQKWLLTGEGEMFTGEPNTNKDVEEATKIFKSLSPEFQDYTLKQMQALLKVQNATKKPSSKNPLK